MHRDLDRNLKQAPIKRKSARTASDTKAGSVNPFDMERQKEETLQQEKGNGNERAV